MKRDVERELAHSCVVTSGFWNGENILKCTQLFTDSVWQDHKLLIIMCEKNFVDSEFSIESSRFCVSMADVSSVSCTKDFTKDLADRMTNKSLAELEVMIEIFFSCVF